MACQTLVDRVVLTVDGEQSNSIFCGGTGHDFSSHHENFLRRHGQIPPGFDGGQRGGEPGGANDGHEDDVGINFGHEIDQPLRAGENLHTRREFGAQGIDSRSVKNRHVLGSSLAGLGGEIAEIRSSSETDDFDFPGQVARHAHRRVADRAGGTEDDDFSGLGIVHAVAGRSTQMM